MSEERLRAARMRAQRLDGRLRDAAELVRAIGGVQAQEPGAGALSIRARTEGLDAAAVERALVEERSIVRTWAMRGTIHIVAAEDLALVSGLFAPRSLPAQQRALESLGVDHGVQEGAVAVIRAALAADGPLTRAELAERLRRAGIDAQGRRAAHLPRLAALEGHVCFGPRRDGDDTYALLDDWLGPRARPPCRAARVDRDSALAELTRRYLGAYGPAAPRDFAAWSGLGVREARDGWKLIAGELKEVDAGWMLARDAARLDREPPDPPLVRLLPAFDTYLLGYRGREVAVPAEHAGRVWPGGGIVRPTVVANGRAVATWRRQRRGARVEVEIEPFDAAPAADEEVTAVRRFLEAPGSGT